MFSICYRVLCFYIFLNKTGDLTESDLFKIDASSGEVSLKKDVTTDDFGKRYNLVVVATQNSDKTLAANLQVGYINKTQIAYKLFI